MKIHLVFKDKLTEENYRKYNFKKRKGILQMQRGALGFFSFLGIFHLSYLMPDYKEMSAPNKGFLLLAVIGLLTSMFFGYRSKFRSSDPCILITNLIINLVLLEPNFFELTEFERLSRQKYFLGGLRISAVNLITLMCYNSFVYKILQVFGTIAYVLVKMRENVSLHDILVDNAIGVLISFFFYSQEKGDRMTYNEYQGVLQQKKGWKHFLNFLPEGIGIFAKDYSCNFMNESVKTLFGSSDIDNIKRLIFNLDKMNLDYSGTKGSKASCGLEKLKDYFTNFYEKSIQEEESPRGRQKNANLRKKKKKKSNNLQSVKLTHSDDIFFTEYNNKFLSLKFTHIDFENTDSVLILFSDISMSMKYRVLEENRKFRDMLFASFSHEIRTPLNCILLLLGKLIKDSLGITEKLMRKYISPSFYSAQILMHLVNDILDYSFLVRDELKLNIAETDIIADCLEIMEIISIQAHKRGIKLILKLDKNLPATFKTDSPRLKQILCHLLLNALKFTYQGKIIVRVMCSAENDKALVITVKDTGIGMKEEDQQRLRVKLKMASLSNFKTSKNAAGASLRTLLSQSLARMIGFQEGPGMRFYSKQNEGTQFRFVVKNHASNSEKVTTISHQNPEDLKLKHQKESAIVIKWVSRSSNSAVFKEGPSVLTPLLRIPNSPSIEFKKESVGDLDFIEESMKRVFSDKDELESNLSEKAQNNKAVPDFNFSELRKKKLTKEISEPKIFIKKDLETIATGTSQCRHSQILVVDDDEFNILSVKTILKQKNLSISFARNGLQAIELVRQEIKERSECCIKFQFILMDVNMPVMGGLEATSILKQEMRDQKIPWMPIIGCTAFVGSNDEAICRENGMDDYQTKPLNSKKVARLIEVWSHG